MIYVDTCLLIAFITESDHHHQNAKRFLEYAADQQKKVVIAESVFIKEFIFKRSNENTFDAMSKEKKQEGLKEARAEIQKLFSKNIVPLQENRKVCFAFQDIVLECNLKRKEIKNNSQDINHLAHCLAYECKQFITFDDTFKNFLIQHGFDFKSKNLTMTNTTQKIDFEPTRQTLLALHEEDNR